MAGQEYLLLTEVDGTFSGGEARWFDDPPTVGQEIQIGDATWYIHEVAAAEGQHMARIYLKQTPPI